jgi:hypothetical protein
MLLKWLILFNVKITQEYNEQSSIQYSKQSKKNSIDDKWTFIPVNENLVFRITIW